MKFINFANKLLLRVSFRPSYSERINLSGKQFCVFFFASLRSTVVCVLIQLNDRAKNSQFTHASHSFPTAKLTNSKQ